MLSSPFVFVEKWSETALSERASYQQHFIDLCHLVGHPTPADMDRTGSFFTFEAGAQKTSGHNGFADVWYKGHFAWEYKGPDGNLTKAYDQLLQYREALENPPLLIVSDIQSIVIHTNFTNTVKRTYRLGLQDLTTAAGIDTLRRVFFHPDTLRNSETMEHVTEKAAGKFAQLADILRQAGHDEQSSAHFLIQLLFCLFAEDTDMLQRRLFTQMVHNFRNAPATFVQQLKILFDAMAIGGAFGIEPILHFNGHLFENACILDVGREGLAILEEVAQLDWAYIEPSILGTLFERSLEPGKRSQLGAHYTSKEDILLVIEPVLMAPLRRRWAEVLALAGPLADQRRQAKGGQRTTLEKKLTSLLMGFASEISSVRVLDAACGSGNFLYLALRQLLDLWKEVSIFAAHQGITQFNLAVAPTPAQLMGIEINETAHQLAHAAVQIGYIQWLRENGFGIPPEPILKPLDNIIHMDAILRYDEQGQPCEPEWPAADVIIGNPPFLGGGKLRSQLGDSYVEDLFSLYGSRIPKFSDLVCYWFEKARSMVEAGKAKRVGLLATNSIRGGANRTALQRIKETGDIFWAISNRDWFLDGAAVNVSMIGFDKGEQKTKDLDGKPVLIINSDLTASTADITTAQSLPENRGICFMGPSAKAPFDIPTETAQRFLCAPLNPNGKHNRDVVRPVASAIDLVQRPRGMWTIDFALMGEEEAALYEMPFEYIKKVVYPIRSQNRRASYAQHWWQYAEARPGMRVALQGKQRFIATPGVSKYRIFQWQPAAVLCNQGTLVFARDDDYFFGILQSKPHELWALRQGTSLEDRPRYTPTTTFETFPFPWPPGLEPKDHPYVQAISSAACELVTLRKRWLNPPDLPSEELKKRTMTKLYNQYPTWLKNAHDILDQAVFTAYGWSSNITNEEILEKLLYLNLLRAQQK